MMLTIYFQMLFCFFISLKLYVCTVYDRHFSNDGMNLHTAKCQDYWMFTSWLTHTITVHISMRNTSIEFNQSWLNDHWVVYLFIWFYFWTFSFCFSFIIFSSDIEMVEYKNFGGFSYRFCTLHVQPFQNLAKYDIRFHSMHAYTVRKMTSIPN